MLNHVEVGGTIRAIGIVSGTSYDIDRFGRLTDFAVTLIDADAEDIFTLTLDEGVETSDLVALLDTEGDLRSTDCEFVVTRKVPHSNGEVDIYYIPDGSTLPLPKHAPVCNHCGNPISEVLGSLYCTSTVCPERLYSRVEYFVQSGAGVPLEYSDLTNIRYILKEYVKTNHVWEKMFIDIIMPDFELSYGAKLYDEDTHFYLEAFYSTQCKFLMYYHEIDDYLKHLIIFILSLSIPGLTKDEIYQILVECAGVRENLHALSSIANYLRIKDDNYYRPYIGELEELSSRILQYADV